MKKYFLIVIVTFPFLTACYYNNLTEIHPGEDLDLSCDSNAANVTYSKSIQPILTANCGLNNSCHNTSSSNPHLSEYDVLKALALNGTLVNAVNHTGTASPMPKNSNTTLPRCSRAKIEVWVAGGALNN